jgi:transposase
MAGARMPDAFFAELGTLLPAEEPTGPEGGRPRVPHCAVIKVLWYVLVTGCRREVVPLELGCPDRTAHRRLRRWNAAAVWDDLHMHFLILLRMAGIRAAELPIADSVMIRGFGGDDATGPSPVEPRKLRTKQALVVD